MDIRDFLVKRWWIFALAVIFLLSFYIRAINIVPDRLLSFDPIFQYRYTKYFSDWGTMPVWDELTYYVGREVNGFYMQPLMHYITATVHWLFGMGMDFSLKTTAAYMSAIYGAIIAIGAFFVAREASNKYGGIMAALLVMSAPQIMIRTFGSSYDTDQIVLFFILMTLYAGFYMFKKRTVASYCLALGFFTAFLLSWNMFWFTFFIFVGFVLIKFILDMVKPEDRLELKLRMSQLKRSVSELKTMILLFVLLGLGILITGTITNMSLDASLGYFLGFAQQADAWIVNISIAELQPVGDIWIPIFTIVILYILILATLSILGKKLRVPYMLLIFALTALLTLLLFGSSSYNGLSDVEKASVTFTDYFYGTYAQSITLPLGRFITSSNLINLSLLVTFFTLIGAALLFSMEKDNNHTAFILVLLFASILIISKGIRFSEFTSALFLVVISAGFGWLLEFSMQKDNIVKTLALGLGIIIVMFGVNMGLQVSQSLGPDINSNWDNAWEFLRTKTPEQSVVGTWWDPGHMITGSAERRVYADGAHCDNSCLYTINDRITDLGKIMATTDENESLDLIRKYQGDSPKVYWIASDDLIGKFQWLQYFGTGCDARSDPSCPLYMQIGESSRTQDDVGNIIFRNYDLGTQSKIMLYNAQVPIPIYVEGINALFFNEIIYYNGTTPESVIFSDFQRNTIIEALQPLERQMNFRFTNQSIPMTVWIPQHYSYIVIIPQHLRDAVFTKMFMLEGQGLEHFKQVFRNEQVKIYEIV